MSSPRILILRTSALGDIVHALPVLSRLRRELPQAIIGWVVEGAFAPLLDGHADIDELLVARLRPWRRRLLRGSTWVEISRFVSRLHAFSPEIVLDLMGNHKAGALAALTLADRRLGLGRAFRREPSSALWITESVEPHGEHAVDHMLSVLDGLGMKPQSADFAPTRLAESPPDFELGDQPFALVHASSAWPNKDYPAVAWGAVARGLSDKLACRVLVAPGPGEEAVSKAVTSAARSADVRAVPPPSIPGLVYLQRRARLVLGGDTGPVHLAHALGTPVVCVMGPTDPRRHGPYAARDQAVWHELPCSFCHRRLDGPRPCLTSIDPEHIVDRARTVLGESLH